MSQDIRLFTNQMIREMVNKQIEDFFTALTIMNINNSINRDIKTKEIKDLDKYLQKWRVRE